MKSNPENTDRFLGVLRRSYLDRETPDVPVTWQADTMRRIRQLPSSSAAGGFFAFGRMAWRLAPVAAALIIVISVALINLDMYPDHGVFDLMTYQADDIGFTY